MSDLLLYLLWKKDLVPLKFYFREQGISVNVVAGKGDWFWIPEGVPHIHKATGVSRLLIIKVPQETVPPEAIADWQVGS